MTTKIVIVSDSHSKTSELALIYEHFKHETDHFIHCGDHELRASHPIFEIYQSVYGNCDECFGFNEHLFLTIDGHRIFVTHGHHEHVKGTFQRLSEYAQFNDCEIVLYGHTHLPMNTTIGKVTFINPGSIYANRGIRGKSFAVLEWTGTKPVVTFYDLDFKVLTLK